MPEHKTWFGRLLASIFGGFVRSAKRTYNNLPKETQDALVHGSGIWDIINNMLDEVPGRVREAIQEKYPDLNITVIESSLYLIAKSFNLSPKSNNLDDTIDSLQGYLKGLEGKFWAAASRTGSTLLAAIFAPPETKLEALASLIGTVYHWLVKKKK